MRSISIAVLPPPVELKLNGGCLAEIYSYYRGKGYRHIILCRILNLSVLAFSICFSTFLLGFINWAELGKCSTDVCHALISIEWGPMSTGYVLLIVYFSVCCLYWLWILVSTFYTVKTAKRMQLFFRDSLELNDQDLWTVHWHQIVSKLLVYNNGQGDAVNIANRLMMAENYMIALFNWHDFPDLFLNCYSVHRFNKTLEWNLNFCVTNYMFDEKGRLRQDFFNGPALAKRFKIVAVLNLLLMPFIAVFFIMWFIMKYAEETLNKKALAGPRQWTPYARWRLREFNELAHLFQERLDQASKKVDRYLSFRFVSSFRVYIVQFFTFSCGALVGTLLLAGLVDSTLLVNGHILNKPLLWYLGILTVALAVCRSFGSSSKLHQPTEVQDILNFLEQELGCKPDDVPYLFRSRTTIFLEELLGVLITPIVLFFCLAAKSDDIIRFLQTAATQNGDCRFAVWNPPPSDDNVQVSLTIHDFKQAIRGEQKKQEQSQALFLQQNPASTPPPPI